MIREKVREKIAEIILQNTLELIVSPSVRAIPSFKITDKILSLPELKEYFLSEASGVFAKKECTKCNYGTKECPESLPNCDHGYISRELTNVELLEAAKMLIKEINTLPSGERLELKEKE